MRLPGRHGATRRAGDHRDAVVNDTVANVDFGHKAADGAITMQRPRSYQVRDPMDPMAWSEWVATGLAPCFRRCWAAFRG